MSNSWTSTEFDIVETLARRVCVMTHDQMAAIWHPHDDDFTELERELTRLRDGDLCKRAWINVHPRLTIEKPLVRWQPNLPPPDFQDVAQHTRGRWNKPARSTQVYWVSRRAANLFGSAVCGPPSLLHRDHDVLLAEVYVLYRQRHPQLARTWFGEHVFPKAGYRVKDPDAFIIGQDGNVLRIIESAGRYSRQQIEDFHSHCVEFECPFEIW